MARMKFLVTPSDASIAMLVLPPAERERGAMGHQWRRVVTINDGKPGERSVSMACMHCTDPLRGGLPGRMHIPHRRRYRIAQQGPVHRLRLLLLRLSLWRAAISASQQFRFTRQDG